MTIRATNIGMPEDALIRDISRCSIVVERIDVTRGSVGPEHCFVIEAKRYAIGDGDIFKDAVQCAVCIKAEENTYTPF